VIDTRLRIAQTGTGETLFYARAPRNARMGKSS
jgi:hypothetical protein